MTRSSFRLGAASGFVCVAFGAIAALAFGGPYWPAVRAGDLVGPDSYMRMVRLTDMLAAGRTLDTVARDGSGEGAMLHWSHLLDGLLVLLAVPFRAFLGPREALHAAASCWGPLCLAAAAYAAAWAAAPFARRSYLWLGGVLLAVSPGVVAYGIAGAVHHHVGVVLTALAVWGWAGRLIAGPRDTRQQTETAGIALGAWAGAGVWLTPETVPLTMMAFGGVGLAWLITPGRGDLAHALALAGLAFALTTLLALLADPPPGGIGAVAIDRQSIVFAGLACAVAAMGLAVAAIHARRLPNGARLAATAAAVAVCAAIWAIAFRATLFGSGLISDPAVSRLFFGPIAEMRPVVDPLPAVAYLLTGVLAAAAAIGLAVRRRSLLLAYVAACLCLLLLEGQAHVRFVAWPEAAGAVALPIVMTLAEQASARWHKAGTVAVRMAVFFGFLLVPYAGALFPQAVAGASGLAPPACRIADAIPLLDAHPGAVVLADANDTPEILFKTRVSTVGSLYHRNVAAFLRLRAAWRSPPSDTVPPEIDAAHVSLVLACETSEVSSMVADLDRRNLADELRLGRPPPWLVRIGANPASGFVLYRVVRLAGAEGI